MKLLKILAIIVLFLALGVGAFVGYFKYQEAQYVKTAQPFIQKVIPELTKWDINVVKSYLAPQALESSSDTELEKLLTWFKKLGALKKVGEPSLERIYRGVSPELGTHALITYSVPLEFEKGEGAIQIVLLDQNGQFKIYYFQVQSTALAD